MYIFLESDSPEITREIGLALGQLLLRHPAVVLMTGDLGSGKTTVSKAIVEGLGLNDLVTSPTFTLMNVYGEGRAFHFDLYRIQDEDELTEIGFDEILEAQVPVLIEWPELVSDYSFERALLLEMRYGENPNQRKMIIETTDPVLMKGLEHFGE